MILQGHILDKLPEIEDKSVHCVITSPPYWGLRDYGLPPQVYDDPGGCEHVWGDATIIDNRHLPEDDPTPKQATNVGSHQRGIRPGAFCVKCNAWRGSLGLEPTPELYLQHMVEVFREIRRVMRSDATCWLNMGDSYATRAGGYDVTGSRGTSAQISARTQAAVLSGKKRKPPPGLKPKDLCMIPARLALALQADGWWLRRDIIEVQEWYCPCCGYQMVLRRVSNDEIIWNKLNPMPESCTDRPTSSHEYVFLLTKSGTSTYWTHRDKGGTRKSPKPDYRWVHKETGEEVQEEPANWRDKDSPWKRINLWRGHDYFYDAEAVREPAQSGPSDLKKMAEEKDRIGGKHKTLVDPLSKASSTTHIGRKRSVGGAPLKQDALGKNTYTGFNERYAENPVAGRNLRSVWNIATQPFPEAHFATFPEKMVQRCIMAGTSERGACPECGAPWERVVERKFCPQNDVSQDKGIRGHDGQKPMDVSSGLQGTPRGNNDTQTISWRSTCECISVGAPDFGGDKAGVTMSYPEPVPCVVLDPFIGSGTVGKVAQDLGRDWIGIELNPNYCDMAEKRTRHRQELLRLG